MWVQVITFDMDKKQLVGIYKNRPNNIRTIKCGDRVFVWFKDITPYSPVDSPNLHL